MGNDVSNVYVKSFVDQRQHSLIGLAACIYRSNKKKKKKKN